MLEMLLLMLSAWCGGLLFLWTAQAIRKGLSKRVGGLAASTAGLFALCSWLVVG